MRLMTNWALRVKLASMTTDQIHRYLGFLTRWGERTISGIASFVKEGRTLGEAELKRRLGETQAELAVLRARVAQLEAAHPTIQ